MDDLDRAAVEARRVAAREVAAHRAEVGALRREHAAYRAAAAPRLAALAAAARAGVHGPQPQRLQRRLDAGATSWREVLDAGDRDPSAEQARRRLRAVVDEPRPGTCS